jgi:putative ABC transport system substrate-binding protein
MNRLISAQQQTKPTIGWVLEGGPGVLGREVFEAFRRGLTEIGFLEGRDVTIEYHTTDGRPERRSALVADLALRRVAVILVGSQNLALAAKAATRTVPIVFGVGEDPVGLGLVASLNRPGGNLTGIFALGAEFAAKRLEVLHKLVPATESIAMLAGRADDSYTQTETRNVQTAARSLGLRLLLFNGTTDSEIATAFATLVGQHAGAVFAGGSTELDFKSDQIISLAASHALPTMFVLGHAAREGGLSSYGYLTSEAGRLFAAYTGRILKGEKPADLPVQLLTRFEFVINLKTARALGLEISPLLLALADEVIE